MKKIRKNSSAKYPTPPKGNLTENAPPRSTLLVILIIIILIIVGLTITILIIKLNPSNDNVFETSAITPETNCSEFSTSEEIGTCIQTVFDEDGNIDHRLSNYQAAINSAIEKEQYALASELIVIQTNFTVRYNMCNEAFDRLSQVNYDLFDQDQLFAIYKNAITASEDCNNNEMLQTYTSLLDNLSVEEQNE